MHGRVKVKAPKEIQAEREREERALALKFKGDLDKAWEKRQAKCFDEDALKLTGKILLQNADYQTIWNFRREIFLHWKETGSSKETIAEPVNNIQSNCEKQISLDEPDVETLDMEKIFINELKFSSQCLIKHPKSYATWHHREWIIRSMKDPPFKEEIQACNHFLDMDERNFHCWDYRRFICAYGKIDLQNELQFTHKKIQQNFSNFSSFYYRSSLLTLAHNEGLLNINDYWDTDYETITNAIFVDPNDQSPWFYHKWLLAADQLINYQHQVPETLLHKVIYDQSHNRLIYQFHQPLVDSPFDEVTIMSEDGKAITLTGIDWKTIGPISSCLWYHHVDYHETIDAITLEYSGKQYEIQLTTLETPELKVITVSPLPRTQSFKTESKLDMEKMNNLKLLLEMEPDNKWINLTMSMITGGPNESIFDKLIEIDPLRRNYYMDQRSKQITEKKIKNIESTSELKLPNLNLTCLYFTNRLSHLKLLDLSNNNFIKISATFNTFIVLETLILDNNNITMIDKEFYMLSLEKLSLKTNRISNHCLEPIKGCPSLKVLDLTDNPIDHAEESIFSTNIKIIY